MSEPSLIALLESLSGALYAAAAQHDAVALRYPKWSTERSWHQRQAVMLRAEAARVEADAARGHGSRAAGDE